MDPDERALLDAARVGHLATADADGRPHVVPVCFALLDSDSRGGAATDRDGSGERDGPTIVTPLDEKPQSVDPTALRRVRDVAENPRVALVVDRYSEDWAALAWVQCRGRARLLAPNGDEDRRHRTAVAALEARYPQYAGHALAERPVLAIDVGHTVSWGALDGPD